MISKEEFLKAIWKLKEQRAYENSDEIRPEDIPQGLAIEDVKAQNERSPACNRSDSRLAPRKRGGTRCFAGGDFCTNRNAQL